MKLIISFTFLFLIGFTATSPITTGEDEVIDVTNEFYPKNFIKYKSHHDIVKILAPISYLNDDSSKSEEENLNQPFFFVEADIDAHGKRKDRGLYIFKDNKAKKLLDNGRDAATNDETPTQVFFGAQDGIYVYKEDTNEAVRYGSVSDSIIGIAKPTLGDAIYILTEDNELFNVTDAGNKKTKINEVVGAKQIVLDDSNNIYFYGQDLQIYVLRSDGLTKVEGLPANPTSVNLIKPPPLIENGMPAVVDNTVYMIYQNGSSDTVGIKFNPKAIPTAYAMEAILIQYYAFNKKIYEYNLLTLLESVLSSDEFKNALEKNNSNIRSLAGKTKQRKINKSKHAHRT